MTQMTRTSQITGITKFQKQSACGSSCRFCCSLAEFPVSTDISIILHLVFFHPKRLGSNLTRCNASCVLCIIYIFFSTVR